MDVDTHAVGDDLHFVDQTDDADERGLVVELGEEGGQVEFPIARVILVSDESSIVNAQRTNRAWKLIAPDLPSQNLNSAPARVAKRAR